MHGDLSSHSIFYDTRAKQIKIYDNELIFARSNTIQNLIQQRHSLPTPELVQCINIMRIKGELDPAEALYLDAHKSKIDVYQIGLTLLEIATYLPSASLFQPPNSIWYTEIGRRIQLVQQTYGANLANIIKTLLEPNPEKRLSPIQATALFLCQA